MNVNKGEGNLEELLLGLLEEVASRFECASVKVISDKGPRRLLLSCSSTQTASIAMIPDPGQVDVFVGKATRLEFLGGKRTMEDTIEDIRSLVEAVVDGRFEETVWEARGRILRSRGLIQTPGGEREVVGWGGWILGFFWPAKKRHIVYEPYG